MSRWSGALLLLLSSRAEALALTGCTVGIDLGTTNSAVAVLRDGKPVIVPNRHGETSSPSVVAYTAEGALVGQDALAQAATNPENTIIGAKRFLGKNLKAVKVDVERAAFAVANGGGAGGVAFLCPAAPAPLAPEAVCAQVLQELLADVERFAGEPAKRAVVTVPAYFSNAQKEATRAAATLAGLEEVQLLSEPVAASLAYGLSGSTGTVVVFDLGAGTFDVSVLALRSDGDVEVLATSGDAHLGGADFDAALCSWLRDALREADVALPAGAAGQVVLATAAEEAKKRLSVLKEVDVGGDDAPSSSAVAVAAAEDDDARADQPTGPRLDVQQAAAGTEPPAAGAVRVSRARLEELSEPLLQRLKGPLYEAAVMAGVTLPGEVVKEKRGKMAKKPKAKLRKKMAKLVPEGKQKHLPLGESIDEIVMVGGATHMVAVRKLVSNLFGVDPRRTVDPMHAVALGAAIQAGIHSGEVQGVRVMAPWQAQLGRMLEAIAEAGDESGDEEGDEASDGGEEDEELEDLPMSAVIDLGDADDDYDEDADEEEAMQAYLATQRQRASGGGD